MEYVLNYELTNFKLINYGSIFHYVLVRMLNVYYTILYYVNDINSYLDLQIEYV